MEQAEEEKKSLVFINFVVRLSFHRCELSFLDHFSKVSAQISRLSISSQKQPPFSILLCILGEKLYYLVFLYCYFSAAIFSFSFVLSSLSHKLRLYVISFVCLGFLVILAATFRLSRNRNYVK